MPRYLDHHLSPCVFPSDHRVIRTLEPNVRFRHQVGQCSRASLQGDPLRETLNESCRNSYVTND